MKHSKPLKRKTQLKRSGPIKPKRPKVRDTRKGGDFDRLVWLRQQPCCACNAPPPSHAHHTIGEHKGLALKAPDSQAMPLCGHCHQALHERKGMFALRVMSKKGLRDWQAAKCSKFQLLYGRFLTSKLSKALGTRELTREPGDQFDGD